MDPRKKKRPWQRKIDFSLIARVVIYVVIQLFIG